MKFPTSFLGIALLMLGAATARAEVVELTAEADAFTYQNSSEENYGKSAFLRVRSNPTSAMRTYVRFDVGKIADRSKITAAEFSVAPYSDGDWVIVDLSVAGVPDGSAGETWVEGNNGKDNDPAGEVTWQNAQATAGEPAALGTISIPAGATGYQALSGEELVNFLNADTDGKVTLVLDTTGRTIQSLDSRLRPNGPKLKITVEP